MLRAVFRLSGPARRFPADRSGATAIEYGLIAALVGLGMLAGLGSTQDGVGAMFNDMMGRIVTILNGG